jgi:pyruvate formate lyase activating enzyme
MYTIYSATGCTRCKIVMAKMRQLGIEYREHDMKAEGKEAFQRFYAANRKAIYRGPDGVEFPILADGETIRQGLGPALARLQAGPDGLAGFFRIGALHKEWLDGIDVSGGDAAETDGFLAVLRELKKNAMKLEIETDGKNAALLETVIREGLADRLVMHVRGPLALYAQLAGGPRAEDEIKKSIALVAAFPAKQFVTTVAPLRRPGGEISYLTPGEVAEAAALIAAADKQQPYLLRLFRPESAGDEALRQAEPLTPGQLLPYRSAARVHQVRAEIEKTD